MGERDDMTCKACIHSMGKRTLHDEYVQCSVYGTTNQYICKLFENNDGTYFNGTWHCPRCGVPVSKWGVMYGL